MSLPDLRPLVLAMAALTGCAKMAVDGEIVDIASGEPLAGVTVTAINSQCQTVTAAAGKFSLTCVPGSYDLLITAEGYIEENIEAYDAGERKRYDIGKRGLVRIPKKKGLLLFQKGEYVEMERALLERRKGGQGKDLWKHYCLPEGGDPTVNRMAAGVVNFFDHEAPRWRPFRLDEDGCAYKMFPNRDSKEEKIAYAENPEFVKHQLKQGKVIVQMKLDRGVYFVADWTNSGFFTKAKIDGEKGFGGYLIVAK